MKMSIYACMAVNPTVAGFAQTLARADGRVVKLVRFEAAEELGVFDGRQDHE